jgi:hypothetical protein
MQRSIPYWLPLVCWTTVLPAAEPSDLWGEWIKAPILAPTEESWFVTTTLWDVDEDAVYSLHGRRLRTSPDTPWRWGWEGLVGMADSGQPGDEGLIAGVDAVVGRRLPGLESVPLDLLGSVGVQGQTIGFPGKSYLNFRLGLAFEGPLGRSFRLRLGYLHLSNANIMRGNEGLDAVWLGLGWTRTL